ncbi:brix domain protein [Ostertagia ostertagi]
MPRRKRKGRSARAARRGLLGLGGGAPKRHRKGKKNDDVLDEQEKAVKQIRAAGAAKAAEDEKARQPHSFVIHRGAVGKYIKALENDIRQIMDPFTAKHLKTLKRNNIKDFVIHGAVLGVTNMIVLTSSDTSVQLRMMRFNQGPTLTFRVPEYSLSRHILSTQKRPLVHQKLFEKPPLVVMNGFSQSGKKHLLLVETFIQNMFPSINIDTLELRTVKRCLMVNYFEEDDTIEIRHYAIRTVASGLNKSVRKLVQAGKSTTKDLPDLSKYKDIADYLLNPGHLSDSEYEGEQEEVVLSQSISEQTGTMKGEKSHIRLMEIGPRMKLELLKVQDGIDEGEVLYHKIIKKTSEELERLKKEAPKKKLMEIGPRMKLELLKVQDGIDEGEVLYHKIIKKTSEELERLKKEAPKKKKLKKRREQETEHRVIRRLENAQEKAKREEEELKAFKEKAARKQAAATGQTEDIENSKEKDREIALNRERELKRGGGGGDGQNRSLEPERKRRRKDIHDTKEGAGKRFHKGRRE